jgi:hypothetical protein
MKAFPNPHIMGIEYCGMDLRDYFAAKYLNGIISNPEFDFTTSHSDLANIAYQAADAMIRARKKCGDSYDSVCKPSICDCRGKGK